MNLLPIERETIISISDEDKSKWHIYTRQQTIINKLLKQGRVPLKAEYNDNGKIYSAEFEIGFKELTLRSKPVTRTLTEEQRKATAERLANARKKSI